MGRRTGASPSWRAEGRDDARDIEFRRRVDDLYAKGNPIAVASVLEVDDVIDPADTRRWLTRGLKMVADRPAAEGKRRPFVDTW